MKDFHFVTENCSGKNVEIDFNEYEVLQMINLCLRRRYNKSLGIKFAKIYLECKDREGKQNLVDLGVNPEEVEQGYTDLKRILGELH